MASWTFSFKSISSVPMVNLLEEYSLFHVYCDLESTPIDLPLFSQGQPTAVFEKMHFENEGEGEHEFTAQESGIYQVKWRIISFLCLQG